MSARDDLVLQALATATRGTGSSWYRANCPFCVLNGKSVDRKRCLGFLVGVGYFHCLRCGDTGMVGQLPSIYQGAVVRRTGPIRFEPPEGFFTLAEWPGDGAVSLEAARVYLRTRVPEDLWLKLRLGACAFGKYTGRVIVPVLAKDGETWLGWVGREWTKRLDGKKYHNAAGMSRDRTFFNGAALLEKTDRPLYVVEGCFDALALYPDAVALLGKASDSQMDLLVATERPVVIVLDGDAYREGEGMAMKLRLWGQRAGNLRMPPGVDPDEMDRQELEADALQVLKNPLRQKRANLSLEIP